MNFIVALFTDTSTELMSGAKSREWVHHNSTNQPTNHSPDLAPLINSVLHVVQDPATSSSLISLTL